MALVLLKGFCLVRVKYLWMDAVAMLRFAECELRRGRFAPVNDRECSMGHMPIFMIGLVASTMDPLRHDFSVCWPNMESI